MGIIRVLEGSPHLKVRRTMLKNYRKICSADMHSPAKESRS